MKTALIVLLVAALVALGVFQDWFRARMRRRAGDGPQSGLRVASRVIIAAVVGVGLIVWLLVSGQLR